MTTPLFSTYRGGENRVTSSIMAVFERIDLALVRDILAGAAGAGDELRAVTFENQVAGTGSVPDARITGRFTWLFETKTERRAYATEGHGRNQLREHAELLVDDPEALLFVLTPDADTPGFITELSATVGNRVIWISFRQLANAMEEIGAGLFGEQTRFLLAELVQLFEVDGLLTTDDTLVVAARSAWPEYQVSGAYVHQPDRSFREDVAYLGFYADGAIQPLVARIRARYPSLAFTDDEVARRESIGETEVARLIEHLIAQDARTAGEHYGIILLSGPDSPDTVVLDHPIVNDSRTASGRVWAWTLGQRYTSIERLRSGAHRTSEL